MACCQSYHGSSERNLWIARILLYLSVFGREFSLWSWDFALTVWLEALSDNASLFLVSFYQAATQLFVILMVPNLSTYIGDASVGRSWNRRSFAFRFIATQKICVLCAVFFVWLIRKRAIVTKDDLEGTAEKNTDALSVAFMLGVCLLGGFSQALYMTLLVAVERDWIVVMAKKDDLWLQKANVGVMQTTLLCYVTAPLSTGWILDRGDDGYAWIVACTILSCIVQYKAMDKICDLVPQLLPSADEPIQDSKDSNKCKASASCCLNQLYLYSNQLRLYSRQVMLWAGVSFSFLYLNVLTFGSLMTAYLVSCDMSLTAVGFFHGVSSIMGIVGTIIFGQSLRILSLETTSLLSIVFFFACLTVSFVGLFVGKDEKLSSYMLMGGVIPSRIGLYMFDIGVKQLFQRTVDESIRGEVGGAQAFLNSCGMFLLFTMGAVFSDVNDFWIIGTTGYASVGVATLCYTLGVYRPYWQGYSTIENDGIDMDCDLDRGQMGGVQLGPIGNEDGNSKRIV